MEVKEKSKKRELIKTIAIIFLAVLLVLTFFSQTIMNYSLPEVATQMASSGTINAKIRGSGAVAANESYEVNIKQTREVRSVCVRVGDRVETGDLLFVLGDIESQELKTAQEALDNARISYQRRVLELSKSYAADDQNVKTIREDLEEAIAKRDANLVTDDQVSYAKGDLASAKSVLDQIQFTLKELNALQSGSEEYAAAKAKVTELESAIKALEAEVEGYETELEKLETGEDVSAERKIRDAESALSDAKYTWKSDWLAYRSDLGNLIEAVKNTMVESSVNASIVFPATMDFLSPDPIELNDDQRMYIEAYLTKYGGSSAITNPNSPSNSDNSSEIENDDSQRSTPDDELNTTLAKKYRTAYTTLRDDQDDVATKQRALNRLNDDDRIAFGNTYQQRRAIQDKLDEAESNLAVARRDLRAAQSEMEAASSADASLKEQIRQYEANQRIQEATITSLESTLAELQEKQTAYKAALDVISAKERELETALSGKDIDKQLNNLDLKSMSLEIQKYEEQVEKYKKDSVDAEITSPVSGVITAINVSAGKETTPDAAMATIDVVDRGYTIKIPVTNDQARQVKVGDTAEVTNYYWGNDITATLEQIAPDPSSAGQKKLLVFRISGDIEAGTNISLSIGQRSATMDTVVPKSALREDSNGKFVFIITSKSTPLGNRYTATRVDVQVLAEDDTSAAVSGLAQNDYVITTSSKPLDAGSQVRMVENP